MDCICNIRKNYVVIFLESWYKFNEYCWNIFYFDWICNNGMNLLMENDWLLYLIIKNLSDVCVVLNESVRIKLGRCENCM
jgi:hypothetical protein